jgi:thiamine transport system permease protein
VSARSWRVLTYGVPLAFLGLFFLYPLLAILDRGLRGSGDAPLDVLSDPVTREVVWFTVWQALASTALTIAVAAPAAYVLGRYRFRGRSLVSAIVVVPFVLPTVVVALAFLAILPDGLERGWAPILVAHAFFNVAVVVRIVGTFWANLDPRVTEAAATLGASPAARAREIALPLLAPALAAAAAIVFLFSFTSFGIVLILGGPRYATVEAEIYNQAVRLFDLRAAAVLSIVQLVCVVVAIWVATRLERRLAVTGTMRAERDTLKPVRSRREKLVVGSASAGSPSSSGCRWPCSSSGRSLSGAGTGSTPTRRSRTRRACSWPRPGRRS